MYYLFQEIPDINCRMDAEVIRIGSSHTLTQGLQGGSREAALPRGLWAVVPVKELARAKQRLKACMGSFREDFTLAMLTDVLAALAGSNAVTGIAVVTADQRVAALAAERGLTVVEETGSRGLNAAIELGVEAVRRLGGWRVVILPADIPLLTGAEVDRLAGAFYEQAGTADDNAIGICPSQDKDGTNCLFLSTRQAFRFQYGPGSFNVHCESARERKRDAYSLCSAAIALDIDEPRHVEELLAFCAAAPRLQEIGNLEIPA